MLRELPLMPTELPLFLHEPLMLKEQLILLMVPPHLPKQSPPISYSIEPFMRLFLS